MNYCKSIQKQMNQNQRRGDLMCPAIIKQQKFQNLLLLERKGIKSLERIKSKNNCKLKNILKSAVDDVFDDIKDISSSYRYENYSDRHYIIAEIENNAVILKLSGDSIMVWCLNPVGNEQLNRVYDWMRSIKKNETRYVLSLSRYCEDMKRYKEIINFCEMKSSESIESKRTA